MKTSLIYIYWLEDYHPVSSELPLQSVNIWLQNIVVSPSSLFKIIVRRCVLPLLSKIYETPECFSLHVGSKVCHLVKMPLFFIIAWVSMVLHMRSDTTADVISGRLLMLIDWAANLLSDNPFTADIYQNYEDATNFILPFALSLVCLTCHTLPYLNVRRPTHPTLKIGIRYFSLGE